MSESMDGLIRKAAGRGNVARGEAEAESGLSDAQQARVVELVEQLGCAVREAIDLVAQAEPPTSMPAAQVHGGEGSGGAGPAESAPDMDKIIRAEALRVPVEWL